MPVTHFDIALRRPLAGGRPFGEVGPYEELKGRLRFAVDPAHPANVRITDVGLAPRNRDGRVEFAADVSLLRPVDPARGSGRVIAAVVAEPDAVLLVRDQLDASPQTIPRGRWRFARAAGGRVVDDPRHVWLEGGFEKGRLYQVAYTAVGAPVLGLSFAALRDCASWLKHDATSPAAGHARWAYAYGRSQTGRFLRTLVHWDLNLDEAGREALDGIIA